ncbi:MAG TPA: hypothetical protein VF759_13065 [Allosphingosinicella sp.]|jgi:hypothetical protein
MTPSARLPFDSQLEKRVSELYDFSLDIARYDGDIEFATGGGTIHYVLDENIFELFVNPCENFSYVMRDQNVRRMRGQVPGREITAMQSALLTGEALLSGSLPGQRGSPYYITEWHRWEFLERVSYLLGKVGRLSEPSLRQAMEAALRAKHDLVSDDDGDLESFDEDPFLDDDMRLLRDSFGASPAETLRFARVRRAAAILAQDSLAEPMQQLHRTLKLDASSRLQNITRIAAPKDVDRESLREAARDWEGRIARETDARAARFHTHHTKSQRAIRNDAQSLALIDWISRAVDPNKVRVVFVTGDPTLFDTYRRAYEEDPEKRKSGADPFFIRRPLQYSTLFSTDEQDAPSRKTLFYSLQQIVELPLTPLRVASVAGVEMPEEIMFRRQSLTLPRIEKGSVRASYFHDAWIRYGHQYKTEQISEVDAQIEVTERMLNGLAGGLLDRRIREEDRRLLVEARGRGSEERDLLFSRYVDRAVESFIRAAVDMWKPQAEGFFRRAAKDDQTKIRRKVPLAVQVAVADDHSGSPLTKLLDSILDDPLEEGSTPLEPGFTITSSFEIFIGAGAMALHANQWRLGDHFCEVAINAFRYFAKYENISEQDASEAHYLCALAKRFRIGEIKPVENVSPYSSATKLYEKALDLLRSSEALSGSVSEGFHSYRSYSERAALGLFYSALCAEIAAGLKGVPEALPIETASIRAFRDSAACLAEALRIERHSGFDARPQLYGEAIGKIGLQVLINITAWHALSPIIDPAGDSCEYPELAREGARNLAALEKILHRAETPLFWLEFYAFKISEGIETEVSRRKLASLRNNPQGGSVELDRSLFTAIQSYWR